MSWHIFSTSGQLHTHGLCMCFKNFSLACHCFTFIKPVGNEETNPCEAIEWYTTPLWSREDLPPPVAPGASTLQSPCPGFSRWFPRINAKNSKNPLILSKFAVILLLDIASCGKVILGFPEPLYIGLTSQLVVIKMGNKFLLTRQVWEEAVCMVGHILALIPEDLPTEQQHLSSLPCYLLPMTWHISSYVSDLTALVFITVHYTSLTSLHHSAINAQDPVEWEGA